MKKILLAVCVLTVMFGSMQLRAQEWYEKIKFNGDFRNRFEYIKDDTVKNGTDVVERFRERLRLRVGATADVAKDIKVGFAFDMDISTAVLGSNNVGGFELCASYMGKIYKKPKPKPVIFCPRL